VTDAAAALRDDPASIDLPPRLLLDEMLGRLARWLRVLGYDAEWAAGRPDDELLGLAARERRLLLTRDTRLLARRLISRGQVSACFVHDDHLLQQLVQLRADIGLRAVGPPRCLVCNAELLPISRAAASSKVPDYVAATQTAFKECPRCRRVMWPGTHWQAMLRVLAQAGIPWD
jgi:uncharacterized protein with PIN domain